MNMLRLGIVGCGRHGQRYVQHIVHDLDNAVLTGLCRRTVVKGQQQARAAGCSYYENAKDLITAPDVDAVVLVVPPTLNPELHALCASERKPVLIEKPLAASLQGARQIWQAVQRAGAAVPLMVAQTLRFSPVVRALANEVASLGRLDSLCLTQRFEPSSLGWLDDPTHSGGGNILHTGIHSFDLIRYLCAAEARRVYCRAWRAVTRATEDNFVAQIELETGVHAAVIGSRSSEGRNGLIEIAGSRGQLMGDHVHGSAYRIRGSSRQPLALDGERYTVAATLKAFVTAVLQQTPPPITCEDGLAAMAIADACYRSVHSGTPIDVERVAPRHDGA